MPAWTCHYMGMRFKNFGENEGRVSMLVVGRKVGKREGKKKINKKMLSV